MNSPAFSRSRKFPKTTCVTLGKCLTQTLFYYETPKIVRFELHWIACVSFVVKLILGITCLYLMFQRDSYQIFDRSPISAVTIKVKHSPNCSHNHSLTDEDFFRRQSCERSIFDVNDFVLPAIENSAVSITMRRVETEHILRHCDKNSLQSNSTIFFHQCDEPSRCILPPLYRSAEKNVSRESQLCWFQLPSTQIKSNYAALDYVIFIKHFIEFPQLSLVRDNLLSRNLTKDYLNSCEYDPKDHRLCPKFRLLKILQLIEINPREYDWMFFYGSLLEIKINWKCDLDLHLKYCEPTYEFRRLDIQPYAENPYESGSNFLLSNHFFQPDGYQLHRIHTHIYNLRLIISVTGEAGRFDLFQTTTSIGSFLGVFGTGSIVCDLLAAFITNFRRVKYDN